jgi:type I restriction enzyme S subunit
MAYNLHQDYLAALPPDWEKVIIDSLGIIYSGGTPSRDQPSFWNGTIPWVTPGEITSLKGKYLTQTQECITEAGLSSSSAQLMPPGTVLVTTRATIGLVAISKIKISTNQGFKSIVPNQSTDSEFYYYLLNQVKSEMTRLASGSTFDEISRKDFASIAIPRPSVKEQRSIAHILDTIDEAIATTTAHIDKLKLAKIGLLHDLLTRGIDDNGELRDPTRHPEQFKDSELGLIPTDWDVVPIGAYSSISSGSTPLRECSRYWQKGTIPWVKTGELNYTIITQTEEKITDYALKETSLSLYPVGTLLMAMYGQGVTRGKVGILGIPATTNQACAAINTHEDFLSAKYLYYYLVYKYESIRNIGHGSNQSNLNESLIAEFPVSLPCLNEQDKIVSLLDSHESLVSEKCLRLEKLHLIKKGLMSDLLTGRVRVQVDAAEAD